MASTTQLATPPPPQSGLKRATSVVTPSGRPARALQEAGILGTSPPPKPPKADRRVSDSSIGSSIKQYMKDVNLNLKRNKSSSKQSRSMSSATTSPPMAQPPALEAATSASPPTIVQSPEIRQAPLQTPPIAEAPELHDEAAADEIKVPALLQQGTPMLKVSSSGSKTRVFCLDPDQGQIIWPSKKSGIIVIENIKEIRTGTDARYYREQFKIASNAEPRWLSIIYIMDGKYKTLHLVAFTDDVFRMWNVTLRALYSLRQDLMDGLGNVERRQKIWEKQYWKSADGSNDQKLDFREVESMCTRLNINSPREDLLKRFKEADSTGKGFLDFTDFQQFVKLLKARPEVTRLFKKISIDGIFNFTAFQKFMQETQKSTLSDQELQRVFLKFSAKPNRSTSGPALAGDASNPTASPLGSPPAPPQTVVLPGPLIELPTHPSPTALTARLNEDIPSIHAQLGQALQTALDGTVVDPSSQAPSALVPDPVGALTQTWSQSTFTSFLLSADNSPFRANHSKIWQDMTRPMSEYFISSSHNTYLVGNQLMGDSTIEGYIRALLHGCRSVELDIYDGDSEPVIYHGRTLTSKVPLRDISQAIAKYAFVASPYPVIISAEIHCGIEQQHLVARIMKSVFGDMLVQAPIRDGAIEELPSPEDLKGRVLLKAKNLYVAQTGEVQQKDMTVDMTSSETDTATSTNSTSSESEPMKEVKGDIKEVKGELKEELGRARGLVNRAFGRKKPSSSPPKAAAAAGTRVEPVKTKMSVELAALLVYTVGVKCRGFNKKETYNVEHVFSLSEKTANKILKQGMTDLVKHNRTHVVRIYPAGTRLNSTNYEPHRYWAVGAQLVAINWQTFDLGYMINHTMFQQNGRSGFVLKPPALRLKDKDTYAKRTKHFLDITVISAQQLPQPRNEAGREILTKSILDPFVEVSLHVPDWSTSPFLPDSPVDYTPASNATTAAGDSSSARTISFKTGVVKNNGFNPVWEEALSLPFDCVGDMRDLIFVRFAVRAEGGDNDKPLAVYCISLGSFREGFRHLPLHDQQMSQYLFSTLFVHVSVRDVAE